MQFPIRLNHFDEVNGDVKYVFGVEDVLEYAQHLPAVDAVPVVRCKDCMHSILLKDTDFRNTPPWRYYRKDCRVCQCNALIEDEPIIVEDNCYCAYGAKMDEEDANALD